MTGGPLSETARRRLAARLHVQLVTVVPPAEETWRDDPVRDVHVELVLPFDAAAAEPLAAADRVVVRRLLGDRATLPLVVGRAHLVLADSSHPDAWAALHGRDPDLGAVADAVLHPSGRFRRSANRRLTATGGRLCVVHRVAVSPDWQGLGLGRVGVALALGELAGSCSAAALLAMAPGTPEAHQASARAALSRYWQPLGFLPLRDGVLLVDLCDCAVLDVLRAAGRVALDAPRAAE